MRTLKRKITKLSLFLLMILAAMSSFSQEAGAVPSDLMLHYRMNDIGGGVIKDASPHMYHGVISPSGTGSPILAPDSLGTFNEALDFNGSSYIDSLAAVIPLDGDFTVSVWAQLNPGVFGSVLLISQGTAGNYVSLGKNAAGNITVGMDYLDTGVPYPVDGSWHHFAVTKSAAGKSLYLDGVPVASEASATANPAGGILRLGADYLGSGPHWDGLIDDVRVYNTALWAGEVQELYDIGVPFTRKGMIAQYEFDDFAWSTQVQDSAEDTYDTIYRSNGVSVRNTQIISTTGHHGDPQSAFAFDGLSDHVEVAEGIDLSQQDQFSISVWALLDSGSTWFRRIFSQGVITDYLSLGKHDNGNVSVGVSWQDTGVPYPSTGEWHHFVVTRSVSETKLYIDGVLRASLPAAHIKPSNTPFKIGCQFYYGEYWPGKIDDLRVFGSTLDADQVQSLYQGMEFSLVAKQWELSYNKGAASVDSIVMDVSMPWDWSYPPELYPWVPDRYATDPMLINFPGPNALGLEYYYRLTPHQMAKLNGAMTDGSGAWSSFTITAWINKDSAAVGENWLVRAGESDPGNPHVGLMTTFALTLDGVVQTSSGIDSTFMNIYEVEPVIGEGAWYHVALTYDGADTKIYINGKLSNLTTSSNASGPLGNLSSFGVSPNGDYNGAIDDVHVYSRALSDDEVFEDLTGKGEEQVVTLYFAGTTIGPSHWFYSYKFPGSYYTPELVSELHDNQDASALNHHKFYMSGVGAEPAFIFDWASADPCSWGIRGWQLIMNEAAAHLNNVLLLTNGKIRLNIVGFSRGCISSMWFAHNIEKVWFGDSLRVTDINLIVHDPVEGNSWCVPKEIYILGDKVRSYMGHYALDERTGSEAVDFSAIIPSFQNPGGTLHWIHPIHGAHETLVGNCQVDGHDNPSFGQDWFWPLWRYFENWTYDVEVKKVSDITRAIAVTLLESDGYGNLKFQNNYPNYWRQSVDTSYSTFIQNYFDVLWYHAYYHGFEYMRSFAFIPFSLRAWWHASWGRGEGCHWLNEAPFVWDVSYQQYNNPRCVRQSPGYNFISLGSIPVPSPSTAWSELVRMAGISDGDSIPGAEDNCPNTYNPDQVDSDGDGWGDACDLCPSDPNKTNPGYCGCGAPETDTDNDQIPDCTDNCPSVYNPDQADYNGDGIGNACGDHDDDGDGVLDDSDNCPFVPNADQNDADNDGLGDACDGCPNDPAKAEPGLCGCGVVDSDTDTDSDGIVDCADNCPSTPNTDQADTDEDGIGDACELPIVTDLSARAKSGKVQLTWSPQPEAESFNVYRSTTPGGPYLLLATDYVTDYCTYLDLDVTNGTTYYYVVTCVLGEDESDPSNECSATPTARIRR